MNETDWSALHQWKADAQVLADKLAANLEPYMRNGKPVRPMFDIAASMGIQPIPYVFRPGSKAAENAFCQAVP